MWKNYGWKVRNSNDIMRFKARILLCEAVHRLGTTWANEMNIGVKHAPGAGLVACPVYLQSSVLSLCYDVVRYYVESYKQY